MRADITITTMPFQGATLTHHRPNEIAETIFSKSFMEKVGSVLSFMGAWHGLEILQPLVFETILRHIPKTNLFQVSMVDPHCLSDLDVAGFPITLSQNNCPELVFQNGPASLLIMPLTKSNDWTLTNMHLCGGALNIPPARKQFHLAKDPSTNTVDVNGLNNPIFPSQVTINNISCF